MSASGTRAGAKVQGGGRGKASAHGAAAGTSWRITPSWIGLPPERSSNSCSLAEASSTCCAHQLVAGSGWKSSSQHGQQFVHGFAACRAARSTGCRMRRHVPVARQDVAPRLQKVRLLANASGRVAEVSSR